MTFSIPNCEQFSTTIERVVRSLMPILVLVYCAGFACGQALHEWNDWLAHGQRQPEPPTVTVVTVPQTETVTVTSFAEILAAEGIRPLTPAELEAEIARFDAERAAAKPQTARKRPSARRKTAGATRVKAAA
jgi:hypothetical protein